MIHEFIWLVAVFWETTALELIGYYYLETNSINGSVFFVVIRLNH